MLAFLEIFKDMKNLSDVHFDLTNNPIGNSFASFLHEMSNFIRVNVIDLILDGTSASDGIAEKFDLLL